MGFLGFDKRKEEERLRMEEEEARRKRREERMRKEAEEEERLRLEEEARRKRMRKEAEEAFEEAFEEEEEAFEEEEEEEAEEERMRKEAEEMKAAQELMEKYGTVNCQVFNQEQYFIDYDDMKFSAHISPDKEYSDRMLLEVMMVYENNECVYYPILKKSFWLNPHNLIRIKAGENRYIIPLSNVFESEYSSDYYVDLPLGPKDIEVIKYLASGKYTVKYEAGANDGTLDQTVLDRLNKFIDVCQRAGVFEQPAFLSRENKIIPFTLFNED